MMKQSRITPDVWLRTSSTTWLGLRRDLKTELLEGLERVARVRAAIAATAKVPELPPVEVHAELWGDVVDDVMIVNHGRSILLRWRNNNLYHGVALPACAATIEDESVLRRVLVHEFCHCFWSQQEMVRTGGWDALLDPNHDPHDDAADRRRLVLPGDWLGENDGGEVIHHNDPQLDVVNEEFVVLRARLPLVAGPQSRIGVNQQIAIAPAVVDHCKNLLAQKVLV